MPGSPHADQDPLVDRLAEAMHQVTLRQLDDPGQQVVLDDATGGGGDADDLLRGVTQLGDARQQEVAEARRDRIFGYRGKGRAGSRQLLDQERIAAASKDHGRHEVRVGWPSRDGLELRRDIRRLERAELQPLDTGRSLELDQDARRSCPGSPGRPFGTSGRAGPGLRSRHG